MPKACRYCNEFFSLASNCERHEQSCDYRNKSVASIDEEVEPATNLDDAIKNAFKVAEEHSGLPKGLLSGNRVTASSTGKTDHLNPAKCRHCGLYTTHEGLQAHERQCSTRYTMTTQPLASPTIIPEHTPQSYTCELKQVAWTACYQTSQGVQVCGGFDTVAFDVGKGFTKQSWLTLEASLRNQPGNSHLFNFRLIAAQILDS